MLASAIDLAAAIREGRLTAHEALEDCLCRIDQKNSELNAVVTLDAAAARLRAKAMDAEVLDNRMPLHGVPVTVKDVYATTALRTTAGYLPLADYVASEDATVVARLKAAGANLFGKTNTASLAGDPQCTNPVFGRTNNPWNPDCTSGGSSGGSAVAIAMGFSALDAGSDIAGSIRIPAAFCGVCGFKATENRIAHTGHIPHLPDAPRSVRHLLSLGLLARSVADLQLGARVIAGPDACDFEVPPVPWVPERDFGPRSLKIAWWDDFSVLPLSRSVRDALHAAVARLEKAGLIVERVSPKGFDLQAMWRAYGAIVGAEVGLGVPTLERAWIRFGGNFLPASDVLSRALASGYALNMRQYSEALHRRDSIIRQLEEFLGQWDAWLWPVAPTVAYTHLPVSTYGKPPRFEIDGRSISYFEGAIGLTVPFSLTGSPVVAIPAGLAENGMPFGVQLVGKRWQDEKLLAVAACMEKVLGGFVPPPLAR